MTHSENPHIRQQGPPYDWLPFRSGDRTFVAYDVPEGLVELYVVSGASRNVRTFAGADAAIYNGELVGAYFDEDLRRIDFCHTWAGTIDSLHVDEWLDHPAIRLQKLPSSGLNALTEAVA